VISVRPASAADARAIADVHVATWRGAYGHVFPADVLDSLNVDERERMWNQVISNEAMAVYVADSADSGAVVGFVSVGPSRDEEGEGELYAIYVHPDAWGSGAGKALMDAAREWLAQHFSTAVLWVLEDNPRARRFYEREGWVVHGRRMDVVRGVDVPEVRYRLSGLGRR
jgi:ribosomal protein S18 acetylase RimI-like enzyme